jgi:ribosome maturation factor RimP
LGTDYTDKKDMQQTLLEEIKKRVVPLLETKGVELVDLIVSRDRAGFVLRFLVDKTPPLKELGGSIPVDKPPGITLDECAQLNREIGRILDEQEILQQAYVLEVASPGLDRPMKSSADFQRNLGKLVKIALHQALNGQNVLQGFLEAVDSKNVLVRQKQGQRLRIRREDIAWAKLDLDSF